MSGKSTILLVGCDKGLFDPHNITFVILPHPRYGPIPFVKSSGSYFELQKAQPRKYGSWFVNQRVISGSSYMMASKFDIKYALLPFFEKSCERFCPLDQIISNVEGCDRINLEACGKWGLEDVCDTNDKLGDDMILYRLNSGKVLTWLRQRVSQAAEVLCKQRVKKAVASLTVHSFNSSAQSGTNTSAVAQNGAEPTLEDIKAALIVLSDYLSDTMIAKLLDSYGLTTEAISSTKASEASSSGKTNWERALELEKETMPYAAPTSTQGTTSENAGKRKMPPTSSGGTAKSSKLGKPGKGAQSITSFFGKK